MPKKLLPGTSALHMIVASAPDLAPSTRDKYLRDLNTWITFAGEHPSGWTPAQAQAYYAHLLARGLRPQSANRLMSSVQYAAKWWSHQERKPELYFAQIRSSKPSNLIKQHALDEETAIQLLATCDKSPPGLRDFALIVVGLETGMRRMSLAAMDLEQLGNKPYPLIKVPMKGTRDELVPVPLSDAALAALTPWSKYLGTRRGPIFRPLQRRIGASGRFDYEILDRGLSPSAIQKMLATRAVAAKVDHVHPHMFRHTFITWRSKAGHAPHEIASITGHTVPGAGALGGYIDMEVIGERMRTSTPSWLTEIIARRAA